MKSTTINLGMSKVKIVSHSEASSGVNSKAKTLRRVVRLWLSLGVMLILLSVSFGSGHSTVWIRRSDGAQFCVAGSGASLVSGSSDLQAAQIKVLRSKKGTDGKMHAQVCGAPRGSTNNYLIDRAKLQSALALGYAEVISSNQ